jgi:hypothetical protein
MNNELKVDNNNGQINKAEDHSTINAYQIKNIFIPKPFNNENRFEKEINSHEKEFIGNLFYIGILVGDKYDLIPIPESRESDSIKLEILVEQLNILNMESNEFSNLIVKIKKYGMCKNKLILFIELINKLSKTIESKYSDYAYKWFKLGKQLVGIRPLLRGMELLYSDDKYAKAIADIHNCKKLLMELKIFGLVKENFTEFNDSIKKIFKDGEIDNLSKTFEIKPDLILSIVANKLLPYTMKF